MEDVGGVDSSKRPAPYSLPQKPNWITMLNSGQKLLRPVELKVTNINSQQQQLPLQSKAVSPTSSESPSTPTSSVKAFPVPLPRKNSSSSNDSGSKTPVPLPRTKFNLPAIDTTSLVLERSASFPETVDKGHPVKPQFSHSISEPTPSIRHMKIDNKTVDSSSLTTVPESSTTTDSTSKDEEDAEIDTWL